LTAANGPQASPQRAFFLIAADHETFLEKKQELSLCDLHRSQSHHSGMADFGHQPAGIVRKNWPLF
jgi:hypothetical protein